MPFYVAPSTPDQGEEPEMDELAQLPADALQELPKWEVTLYRKGFVWKWIAKHPTHRTIVGPSQMISRENAEADALKAIASLYTKEEETLTGDELMARVNERRNPRKGAVS